MFIGGDHSFFCSHVYKKILLKQWYCSLFQERNRSSASLMDVTVGSQTRAIGKSTAMSIHLISLIIARFAAVISHTHIPQV